MTASVSDVDIRDAEAILADVVPACDWRVERLQEDCDRPATWVMTPSCTCPATLYCDEHALRVRAETFAAVLLYCDVDRCRVSLSWDRL